MIAKRIKQNEKFQKNAGQHIRDLADYILNAKSSMNSQTEQKEKVLCSGGIGFTFNDADAQISEMVSLAAQCPKSKNPVNHYILSWQHDEQPTPVQIEQAVKIFIDETGLQNPLAIWGAHSNTENIHVHIQVCRIDSNTEQIQKINNGFDKIVCQKAIARIEAEQGWNSEQNALYKYIDGKFEERNNGNKISISDGARYFEHKNKEMSAERRAKLLLPALKQCTNWQELHSVSNKQSAFYNLKAGGAVIRFADSDQFVKASTIAREFSRANLEKKFGAFEEPQKQTNNVQQKGTTKMNIETVEPIKFEIVEEQKKETPEKIIDEVVKKEEEEQKKKDAEVSKVNTLFTKNTFVSFIDKMGDGKDILQNEQVISQLQKRYYTFANNEQMLFEKIKSDAEKCNIKLSDEQLQVVSKTAYNTVHATREVADTKKFDNNDNKKKEQEEKQDENAILALLMLLLQLILALFGIGTAKQAEDEALKAQEEKLQQEKDALRNGEKEVLSAENIETMNNIKTDLYKQQLSELKLVTNNEYNNELAT